jgi:Flp pilus assembly protein TadD
LYRRKEYGRAFALIKESAAELPESSSIQYHLGIAAQQMGDTSTAREALTKAVSSSLPFAGKEEARKALEAMR